MFTVAAMKEITLTLKNARGESTILEPFLYEMGQEIERVANLEMQRSRFVNPFASFHKPYFSSRPFSSSTMMHPRDQFTKFSMRPRIRISRLTPHSVTVSMPREVLPAVAARMPEIVEMLEHRIEEMLVKRLDGARCWLSVTS